MSDDKMIEAWLAGELSDEMAKAFEQSLEDTAPADLADQDFIGIKVEPLSAEVDQLIKRIREDGGHTPPDIDQWRDILQPSDDPDLLGTLGTEPCYEISSVIAVGGMSIVFKGRDPKLNRTVAIKTLTPELAANRTTHERFLREARVAAGLEHENILPIYGVHDDSSLPFFAMKFIEGGTLQDALDTEPLPFEQQLSIAHQIASALGAAHDAGVIHRDIKPANILLEAAGKKAYLCDFGIARSTDDPSLTYTGSIAGTPHFMAPEQATGGEIDHRSDLFSLGAVLYHAATGSPPFPGKTSTAVIHGVTTLRPDPARRANPDLPRWFETLLERLLAKPPNERPQSAEEVVRSIDTASVPHRPTNWKRPLIFASLALLIAGLAFYVIRQPAAAPQQLLITTASDEDDGSADPSLGSGTSLREAVTYGEAEIPITFSPELSGVTLAVTNSVIPLESERVIDASGLAERPVIDAGKNGHAHFHLSLGGDLTLKSLTLTGGVSEGDGGSIHNSGGKLTLEDCDFIDNQARSGGAIVIRSGTVTLLRCRFESNRAENHPTFSGGGAINISNGNMTITGCRFVSNSAENNGGALRATISRVTLDNCTFVENHAPVGGCVRIREGAILNIHNCKFEKNRAKGASVVAAHDGELNISASSFTGNVATETTGVLYASRGASLAITDSTFRSNTAVTTAGAVYHNGHTLKLHNCQFKNNTAPSGGAVHIVRGERIDVHGNTFTDNTAPQLLTDDSLDTTNMINNVVTPADSTFKDTLKRFIPNP